MANLLFERFEKYNRARNTKLCLQFAIFQLTTVNLVATLTVVLLVGGCIAMMALLLKSQKEEAGKLVSICNLFDWKKLWFETQFAFSPLNDFRCCYFTPSMLHVCKFCLLFWIDFNFCYPVDCDVGPWGAWTSCSATCGVGDKNRTRKGQSENLQIFITW